MSKKIPKLIIYGITTIPTITVLACGESLSIDESISVKDKSQLVIKTKSKQKNIINQIKNPTKDDKKHDAKLFSTIDLTRKKVIKAINDAKTVVDAIKVGKDGVIALKKAIENYNDSKGTEYELLKVDKAKFSSFKHLIVGKEIPILKDGPTTAKELIALTGHGSMPDETPRVIRTFAVQTNNETGIATIIITFTLGDLTDTTTYKISGFKIVDSHDFSYGFMYQTQDGTIYVGTKKGLKKKLEDNEIKIVGKTNAWYKFMYENKKGTIYLIENGVLKKLEGDKIVDVDFALTDVLGFFYQTKEGTIYLGTTNGLKKLVDDGKGGKKLDLIYSNNVSSSFMYQTQDGTIYVGTKYDGLLKLKNNALETINSKFSSKFMYQTQDNTIYVGAHNGLKKLVDDGKGGKKLDLVAFENMENSFMYQTQDGTIYVMGDGGLKKLVNGALVSIDTANFLEGFLYQTKDGTIYLGTKNSLKKFPKS